jgi:hypothetical protein
VRLKSSNSEITRTAGEKIFAARMLGLWTIVVVSAQQTADAKSSLLMSGMPLELSIAIVS